MTDQPSVADFNPLEPVLTRQEYGRLRAQLDELRRVRDRDLPRIAQVEDLLRNAHVIDDSGWAPGAAGPGWIVTVRYGSLSREVAFVLGTEPLDAARPVSPRSPVGQALLGRCAGDVVSVDLPNGRTETLTILRVAPADPALAA